MFTFDVEAAQERALTKAENHLAQVKQSRQENFEEYQRNVQAAERAVAEARRNRNYGFMRP